MNYRLLILGTIFLFNPEINILDFLPDFIGVLLILRAVTPLSPLTPTAAEGVVFFKRYAVLSIVQLVAVIPMLSVAGSDPAFYLVFTFAFALLSLLFIIPAYRSFFSGLGYLAEKNAIQVPRAKIHPFLFSSVFVIKKVLALLPEMVYLYIDDENVYDVALYPLAAYKTGITVITFVAGLVLGLIWLVLTIRELSRLRRNAALNAALSSEIAAAVHFLPEQITSTVSSLCRLMTVSAFLMLSLFIDGIPVFPLFFSSACLFGAVRVASRLCPAREKKKERLTLLSLLVGLISFAAILFFNFRYHETALMLFSRVAASFILPALLHAVSCVFFILALRSVFSTLEAVVREHTGSYWESSFFSHNSSAAKEKSALLFKLRFGFVSGAVLAASDTVAYSLLYVLPLYQIVNAAVLLLWAAYMSSVYAAVRTAVNEKYADRKRDSV